MTNEPFNSIKGVHVQYKEQSFIYVYFLVHVLYDTRIENSRENGIHVHFLTVIIEKYCMYIYICVNTFFQPSFLQMNYIEYPNRKLRLIRALAKNYDFFFPESRIFHLFAKIQNSFPCITPHGTADLTLCIEVYLCHSWQSTLAAREIITFLIGL